MYRDTVTLFCFHDGIWRATTLKGVDLNADRAAILAKYGTESADRARLHIAYKNETDNGIQVCDGVLAVNPKDYDGSEGTITFASGDNFTFFVRGKWNGGTLEYDYGVFDPWEVADVADGGSFDPWDEGIILDAEGILTDDNMFPQGFYNYMNETYGEAYAVSSVAIYSVIPHFEIMGK